MTASTSTPSSSSSSSGHGKIPSSSKSSIAKQSKQKRNERERKRVDQVNQGFQLLQERVPKMAGNKTRMSKVETLREAARYIQELQKMLGQDNSTATIDFPTPQQSPIYPPSVCSSMVAQTPSPSYVSPYYPAPQMMMSNQYYSGQDYPTDPNSFYMKSEITH